jgi:tetratricopeptide (TPR) repeat protein
VSGRTAAIAAVAASAAVSAAALVSANDARSQRYAAAPAAIDPVPMSASCQTEAAADVDLGAAWLLVRAANPARAAFERAVDRDPDCALGYWGQALARFDDAADGSTPIVAAVEATIARAAAVPARTAFERAAVAALGRLRAREAAPGVPAAWPARVAAYRDALCAGAAADRLVRLWCARALADTWTALPAPGLAPGVGTGVPALEHVVELARTQPLDVGAAVIVLEVAPDPQAPIVARALAAVAAANPPAPVPHALAARTAIRRGEWTIAVTAAERARAAGPEEPRAADALHAQIDALLQLGRRAEAYGLAHRALSASGASGATGGAPAETAARLYARVVLGDRRLDGRGLGDRAALPLDERTAGLWPVIFVAGLDAALRAWPGPDATLVARARAASTQLAALAPESPPSEIAWARTLIDAAIAASQDEHPELALRLVHAIDVERALAIADPTALPLLPARELGAELWLRTYRYDDARRDARALLDAQPQRISPFVVLARASARVKDTSAAAEAWRRVLELRATADADDTIRLEAQRALEPAR